MDLVNVDFSTFSLTFKSTHNLSHQYVLKNIYIAKQVPSALTGLLVLNFC